MHFGENQLSRSLIGLSPLPTAHPPSFQPRWVRSSTRSYTCFNLAMGRSPRFGSRTRHYIALFGLALATTTPHGLTSRHATDSQAHSSKGTPPPPHTKRHAKALTACKRPVSGTISLPSRGTFHHSLTVLSTIGHQEVFRQPSGLGRFTQDSTSPVLLGQRTHTARTVSPTGVSPTTPPLPRGFSYRTSFSLRPTPADVRKMRPTTPQPQPLPGITRKRFNHHPLSLATTHGISSPTGTEMFHFPASPPTPYTIQMQVTRHNSCRVPPFGNPRITARQPAPRGISQATTSFIGP